MEQLLAVAHAPASAVDFIALHGQTVWHEPPLVSWQLGEPAVLAERFGRPVVNNFRSRDVAAGGQGAPLVPAADVLLFGATDGPRVLLNIGGMANVTYVGRRAIDDGAMAFDTGPGTVLVDAVARLVDPALPYDRDGALASRGAVNEAEVTRLLADGFFRQPPPRSTGREHFGVPADPRGKVSGARRPDRQHIPGQKHFQRQLRQPIRSQNACRGPGG